MLLLPILHARQILNDLFKRYFLFSCAYSKCFHKTIDHLKKLVASQSCLLLSTKRGGGANSVKISNCPVNQSTVKFFKKSCHFFPLDRNEMSFSRTLIKKTCSTKRRIHSNTTSRKTEQKIPS